MSNLRELRRARGWSQAQLIAALRREAGAEGRAVPGFDSLRITVSRWENGRVSPDDFYRRYLRAIFACSDADLGFVAAGEPSISPGVFGAVSLPDKVRPELLSYLRTSLVGYAEADNLLGAGPLIPVVSAQAGVLEQLVGEVVGPHRRDILQLGSQYAEMCGWLHQDAGDLAGAQTWSDRALGYAQELGDEAQLAYVLMRKSNIATDAGQSARALGLAEAALRQRAPLVPLLEAVALRQQALALSVAGDERGTARALEAAQETVSVAEHGGSATEAEGLTYVTSAYIASESGQCWLRLGRPAKAVTILERGLTQWPPHLRRDRGLMLTRLALAHLRMGEVDQACAIVEEAAEIAASTASSRTAGELRALRQGLARWSGQPLVDHAVEVLR